MDMTGITFQNYTDGDYEAVCDFLIERNRQDRNHIHWNWARFEWMMEHPAFHRDQIGAIGLWKDQEKVVGAAIYDMYFGEGFCGALPEYEELYPAILTYACRELRDWEGFGLAVCDNCASEIEAVCRAGLVPTDGSETMLRLTLDGGLTASLPEGLTFAELNPAIEAYDFQWLLWQGFDHGTDRAAFESAEPIVPQIRRHFNPRLSVAAVNSAGEKAGYCCVWYHPATDYAYVEPVCVIPSYRGQGVTKAVVSEALNRAAALGAKTAYVLSDMMFYQKLGFQMDRRFSFYWKK